jgi:transcription factor SFP1
MEKEKPYKCETCGKRYKNLNGLKYHKSHSPPCNPELQINGGRGASAGLMPNQSQNQNIGPLGAGLSGDAGMM